MEKQKYCRENIEKQRKPFDFHIVTFHRFMKQSSFPTILL